MTHATDGDLLAWIDGDLDPPASDAVEAHLGECPDCRRRRTRLEGDARQVREWLRRADSPAPPPEAYARPWRAPAPGAGRPARHWIRAAAAVAALALAVGPARAWIARSLASNPPAPTREAPAPPAPAPAQAPQATTAFRPEGARLTVGLGADGDAVRIRFEASPDDRVQLWAPWDDVGITVRPDRVDLSEVAGRSGTLRLAVPASIRGVTVVTPAGARRSVAVDADELPRTTGPGGGPPDAGGR